MKINTSGSGGLAHIAIVGATGAVGRELLHCLDALKFPVGKLDLLASSRSAGQQIETAWGSKTIIDVENYTFLGVDIALFSAGKSVSLVYAPKAVAAGALVIDNTSAFRMDPKIPLVVPEVNAELIRRHTSIIANPNCSTIQLVLALKALDLAAGLETVRIATYQSCSGAGQKGIDALLAETADAMGAHVLTESKVHARNIAFNVVPQIGAFTASGFTEEEEKMMQESRKILGLPELRISATCVRVPVMRGHSEVVHVGLKRALSPQAAREAMQNMPSLVVCAVDDCEAYATPKETQGHFETYVGRLRSDPADVNGLIFWIVSDNLLKGAALNAVQIAKATWNQTRMDDEN